MGLITLKIYQNVTWMLEVCRKKSIQLGVIKNNTTDMRGFSKNVGYNMFYGYILHQQ